MSTWIGKLQFGLVTLDVSLERAVVDRSISFSQFDAATRSKIHRKNVNDDGDEVAPDDIIRGFVKDDKVVLFSPAEMAEMKGNLEHAIEIIDFVPRITVPSWTMGTRYYVLPRGTGAGRNKSYKLLLAAMSKASASAVVRFVLRTKQYTGICYVAGDKGFEYLMLGIVPYADEIVDVKSINELTGFFEDDTVLNRKELAQAKVLVESMLVDKFIPEHYTDEFRVTVTAEVERRLQAKDKRSKSNVIPITRNQKKAG